VFSERLYQSIELMERYSVELAVDLFAPLNLVINSTAGDQPMNLWRALFSAAFRFAYAGCWSAWWKVAARRHATTRESLLSLADTLWEPDLKALRAIGPVLILPTRRPWIC